MEYKTGYYLFNHIQIEEGKLDDFLNSIAKNNWELVHYNKDDGFTILKRQLPIKINLDL